MNGNVLATEEVLEKTVKAIEGNGFTVFVVENGEEAKEKALSLLPEGSEVFTNTSTTNNTIGLTAAINESGKYKAVHPAVLKMDQATEAKRIKEMRSVPDYAVGSVHAITEDGRAIIASGSGSQLPSYAYGADHVIWVVGTQKLVKNIDDGIKRIYDYILPFESERLNKAYNITSGSSVNRILIMNTEKMKDRVTIILVKESLGF